MKVEYNFKPYSHPKRALYYQTGNEYVKDPESGLLGWSKILVETVVIGEDDTSYVEYLKEYKNCDTWDKDYGQIYLLPMGFHKSRLLKWVPTTCQQLLLFDLISYNSRISRYPHYDCRIVNNKSKKCKQKIFTAITVKK